MQANFTPSINFKPVRISLRFALVEQFKRFSSRFFSFLSLSFPSFVPLLESQSDRLLEVRFPTPTPANKRELITVSLYIRVFVTFRKRYVLNTIEASSGVDKGGFVRELRWH